MREKLGCPLGYLITLLLPKPISDDGRIVLMKYELPLRTRNLNIGTEEFQK